MLITNYREPQPVPGVDPGRKRCRGRE